MIEPGKQSNKSLEIFELSVVIIAKNHNPTILNPDFLKYNDIVPKEWDLAKKPICADMVAQVTYKNSVNITAQLDRVIFSENIKINDLNNIDTPGIAGIACRYANTLPHVDYKAVGINPKGHVSFGEDREGVQKYLAETILADGPWQGFGNAPVKVVVKFSYTLDRGQCNLSLEEATFTEKAIKVLLVSANFHRDIIGETQKERLTDLDQIVENWRSDIETYRKLVNDKFLKGEDK